MYRLIIGVVAAALLAAGCGSGGDEATAQVSEAQFMKQAKTICAKTQKEITAGLKDVASGKADLFELTSSKLEQEAEKLEAITGPEDVEAKVEPLIENIRQVSELLAKEQDLEDPRIAAYKEEAKKLGLTEC